MDALVCQQYVCGYSVCTIITEFLLDASWILQTDSSHQRARSQKQGSYTLLYDWLLVKYPIYLPKGGWWRNLWSSCTLKHFVSVAKSCTPVFCTMQSWNTTVPAILSALEHQSAGDIFNSVKILALFVLLWLKSAATVGDVVFKGNCLHITWVLFQL